MFVCFYGIIYNYASLKGRVCVFHALYVHSIGMLAKIACATSIHELNNESSMKTLKMHCGGCLWQDRHYQSRAEMKRVMQNTYTEAGPYIHACVYLCLPLMLITHTGGASHFLGQSKQDRHYQQGTKEGNKAARANTCRSPGGQALMLLFDSVC